MWAVEVPVTCRLPPWIDRREPGLVVPIPMFPASLIKRRCPDEPTNKVEVAIKLPTVEVPDVRELPCTESNEAGVEVPSPSRLLVLSQIKLASP